MRLVIASCLAAVLLTGCAQKSAFEDLADGACTNKQAQLVDEHISGQIDAIAKKEWKSAYSFASPKFRASVDIDQFISVISTSYGMLIENQGYKFNKCSITGKRITQDVGVKSGGRTIDLTYTLSVTKLTLGVESAVVNNSGARLNT
jgi:hypothetical protein